MNKFDIDNMQKFPEISGGLKFGDAGKVKLVFTEMETDIYLEPVGENDPAIDITFDPLAFTFSGGKPFMELFTLDGERLYKTHWRLFLMAMTDGVDPRTNQKSGHKSGGGVKTRWNIDPTEGHVVRFSRPSSARPNTILEAWDSGQDINDTPLENLEGDPKELNFDGVDYLAFPVG